MSAFAPNKPATSASDVLALGNPLCSSLDAERVAQRGSVLAFGLPDNPLAHFVCLNAGDCQRVDSRDGGRGTVPTRQPVEFVRTERSG